MAKSTSVVPLPEHNPQTPTLLATPPSAAPALSASPPPQVVTDMPSPDANPYRTAALPFAMRARSPGNRRATTGDGLRLDPETDHVLRPFRFRRGQYPGGAAQRDGRGGEDQGSRGPRFRALVQISKRAGDSGNAEDIEQFRLSHPDWPAQDELREKAETALFLTDDSPEEVKAFFKNSAPLTGAGKAALAGVYMKENNEAAASAW